MLNIMVYTDTHKHTPMSTVSEDQRPKYIVVVQGTVAATADDDGDYNTK